MAAGAITLSTDGKRFLAADGKVKLASASGCCCGCLCADNPKLPNPCVHCATCSPSSIIVTLDGVSISSACHFMERTPDDYSIKSAAGTIDGTYCLPHLSGCQWRASITLPLVSQYVSLNTTCDPSGASPQTSTTATLLMQRTSTSAWVMQCQVSSITATVYLFNSQNSDAPGSECFPSGADNDLVTAGQAAPDTDLCYLGTGGTAAISLCECP
jgi:hypothetical protein